MQLGRQIPDTPEEAVVEIEKASDFIHNVSVALWTFLFSGMIMAYWVLGSKRWCAKSLCSIGYLFPHRVWPCSGHCRPHYHHNHKRLHTCNILAGPLSSLNSRLTRSSSLNQPTYPHTKMTLAKPVTDLLQAMLQTEASSRPTANEALILPPCTYACD